MSMRPVAGMFYRSPSCRVDFAHHYFYRQTPAFVHCKVKAGFKVSSGRGAVLVMDNDVITTVDPPGSLRRLLDDKSMEGCVIVSQTHRCSSYARLLTSKGGKSVAIGLSIEPPVSGVVAATADAKWVRSSSSGNFKSKVNLSGERDYYPLFRLVSLKDNDTSSGLRGELDGGDPPLADAVPPWQADLEASGAEEPNMQVFSLLSCITFLTVVSMA